MLSYNSFNIFVPVMRCLYFEPNMWTLSTGVISSFFIQSGSNGSGFSPKWKTICVVLLGFTTIFWSHHFTLFWMLSCRLFGTKIIWSNACRTRVIQHDYEQERNQFCALRLASSKFFPAWSVIPNFDAWLLVFHETSCPFDQYSRCSHCIQFLNVDHMVNYVEWFQKIN